MVEIVGGPESGTRALALTLPVPLAYTEDLYVFREHIDIVRRRLLRRLSEAAETRVAATRVAG